MFCWESCKLLLPEEMDSQNNEIFWMCLELCIFSSIAQQFTCKYSNSKAKLKGKQLCPYTLGPEQPKGLETALDQTFIVPDPSLKILLCFNEGNGNLALSMGNSSFQDRSRFLGNLLLRLLLKKASKAVDSYTIKNTVAELG